MRRAAGSGQAGVSRAVARAVARWSTRIRRNMVFLTKMPHSGRTGSGWRDPSLATAVNPVELRSHATPARPTRREMGCVGRTSSYRAGFRRAPSGRSPVVTGRAPDGGVGAVGKSPAEATVESLASAGDLSTAVATAAMLGRVGLQHATLIRGPLR